MNALKKLFVAGLSLAAIAGASAQTTIRIIGSTAFRSATITGIQDILQPGYTYGYSGTTGVTKASQAVFSGTTKSSNSGAGIPVVIQCSWTGSVGGVQTLAQLTPAITTATFLSAIPANLSSTGVASLSSGYDAPAVADITMSDSFQASTQFSGGSYLPLADTKVGIVPFVFAKGLSNDTTVTAALARLTNITPLQAKAILGSGALPLSVLDGTVGDSGIDVLAVGRDEDSGTRLAAFAETGFGIFSAPQQYQPTIAGGVITAIPIYQAQSVDGLPYPAGHSGYSSGGTLATTLNTPVQSGLTDATGSKFALIGLFRHQRCERRQRWRQ